MSGHSCYVLPPNKKNGGNYDSAIQKNYMYIKMIAMQPKIDWNNDHLYFSLKIQSK